MTHSEKAEKQYITFKRLTGLCKSLKNTKNADEIAKLESQIKQARADYRKIKNANVSLQIIKTNNADGSFGLTFL